MLRKLEEDKIALEEIERNDQRYHAAVSENEKELKPDYVFADVQAKLDELDRKIIVLKHAINKFNSSTVVYEGLTIDQILVKLPQMNKRKRKYQTMKNVPPKIRCSITGNVIDYLYTSYDPAEVDGYYEAICKEIDQMQTELDIANNSLTFEVTW